MINTARSATADAFARAPLPKRFCNLDRLLHAMKARGLDGIVATAPWNVMKLPRRNFLHLAAGAAGLPAVSRLPIRRGQLRSSCRSLLAGQLMLLLASLANTWLGYSDSSSLRMCLGPAVRLARPVQCVQDPTATP